MRITRRTAALTVVAAVLPAVIASSSQATGFVTDAGWEVFKPTGGTGSEPGIDIGVDADGDEIIYLHGTYGIPSHNKGWSKQAGDAVFKPFTFSAPYNRLPGGGDADIAFRGDDVWFIDLWAGSNSIQYSPDKGATWTLGTPFTTLPLSDRQWIALGPTTEDPISGERRTILYVTYQFIQPGLGTWLARSSDNGLTWDFHTPIAEGAPLSTGTSGIPAHIVSDGDQTVAVAMNTGNSRFEVAVSTDGGSTWDINPVSPTGEAMGSLVGFSMNHTNPSEMAIAYPAAPANPLFVPKTKTIVRTSSDGGITWNAPIAMEPDLSPEAFAGPMDWFPWVDYRGDKIAVAWYQSAVVAPNRDVNLAPASNFWSVWYAESLDDGATFSDPIDIGTGSVKKGGICTNGLGCDADRELGDFLQLAIDLSGKSWVTFVNAGGQPAKLPGGGIYVLKQP